jgi:glycerophosphoryl diester phosphodiesterase
VPLIVAHRGYSGRQPEQTPAAYREAIDWSEQTGIGLLLECDVQFSADDELICLHDLTLDRTSNGSGPAYEHTLAELRALDFGSWKVPRPTPEQSRLITLNELLAMVADARSWGVDVELAIETKHPNPRGPELEARLPAALEPYGWTAPGSPVRLLSFAPDAVERMATLLPGLERTLLIEKTFGPWRDGHLPSGAVAAGVDVRLLREDPGYADRLHERGGLLNAWTLNSADDLTFALKLGADYLSTDFPDRARDALAG